MRDFQDEVPGYLHNRSICETLAKLTLRPGVPALAENLRLSYEALVAAGFFEQRELQLVEAWIADLP
jgi:hypothetical protein